MFVSKQSHSNYKMNHFNISQLPASSKIHHIYLDPCQFPRGRGWLDVGCDGKDILHDIKAQMGSVRHTPFNEEMQTIFETENLSVLEGNVINTTVQVEKTPDEQSRDRFARVKMHIRSMIEFQEEARKVAIRMVKGKMPYLNPADAYECQIAIENGMFLSMCNQEERQLKFTGLNPNARFKMLNEWACNDVDSEHPTRKQVKNELQNISVIYNTAAETLKDKKIRLVFATIVD